MSSYLLRDVNKERRVATITFNRPERLNAWTNDDEAELNKVIAEVEKDEAVKVIVFKGAGKAFGSGHHVQELGPHHGWTGDKERRPSQRQRLYSDDDLLRGRRSLFQSVLYCDKATIAQIHGYCYGGHMEFAAMCDISIASEDSMFIHAGYRYIGPLGGIAYMMHVMGVKKTKQLMLAGPFNAEEALQCSLVNKVVPRDKLEEEVDKMADTIAKMPIDAIVMGKANFELAMNILGVATGMTAGYITHTLQTNIRYEPDEFNLFKAKRDKGVKGAIADREAQYGGSPLARL